MKKVLSIIVVLILSITVITGCTNSQQTPPQPSQGVSDAQQAPVVQAQQSANPSNVDTSNFIGEDKAKEIALERAGITADGVIFDRIELDFDDGVWQYEVEFRLDRTEYDADIKAEDGTIIAFETDYDD